MTLPFWLPETDTKVAAVVGPVFGGVFTDKLNWRWCFMINPPLCAISVAGIGFLCPKYSKPKSQASFRERIKKLDYIGPPIFLLGVTCLLLSLQWGGIQYAWNSPILIGLFCGFGVFMAIWMYSQHRLQERATIRPRLFIQRTVLFTAIYSFFYVGFQVVTYYLPLYFQAVKETTAMESSIYILPIVISVTITAAIGGVLLSVVGYVVPFMIGGCAIASTGIGLISTFGVSTPFSRLFGYQVMTGIGVGLSLQVKQSTLIKTNK